MRNGWHVRIVRSLSLELHRHQRAPNSHLNQPCLDAIHSMSQMRQDLFFRFAKRNALDKKDHVKASQHSAIDGDG